MLPNQSLLSQTPGVAAQNVVAARLETERRFARNVNYLSHNTR
jgi:hypothetical protein